MIEVIKVDTQNKGQVKEFIDFHYELYQGTPQWVPPFFSDMNLVFDRKKHPFYEKNAADFFMAKRDGKVVARVAATENAVFNDYHHTKKAQFYYYDSFDDQEASDAVFNASFQWARDRKLDTIVGPKGFGILDGYGIQIEGNENRAMMTMMNYNFPYYRKLVEGIGFEKEVDFVSCYITREQFVLPSKVQEVARRVEERGYFHVKDFKTKKELRDWSWRIGQTYNQTFVNNWEYYPLTEREIQFLLDSLLTIADPKMIKVIMHKDEIIGFLFGFPDISEALQRQKGKVGFTRPWGIIDILQEFKKTTFISLNGAGVLPEFQGRGANALLYNEMAKFLQGSQFEAAELTQVAETAVQMRKDLKTVGGKEYKNHRVFKKSI
jgi:hypothetical protein